MPVSTPLPRGKAGPQDKEKALKVAMEEDDKDQAKEQGSG